MSTALKRQILYNCEVSDARHAGLYSICGLALRLRDLYKWEYQLPPWREGDPDAVLDWIGRKEEVWDKLAEADYKELTIDGHSYDPFDTRAINAVLADQELFYGAGYAYSLKPTFFLAPIVGRTTIRQRPVWYLGRELARDLLTLPAFTQDGEVVLRTAAAAMHLWDQIAYLGNSGRPALAFALRACCGSDDTRPEAIGPQLDRILAVQQVVHVQHELSEIDETVFDPQVWRRIIADYPHTAVELLVRTLKDMLADSGPQGTLSYLIKKRHQAGLGLYMAFMPGLATALFGNLRVAFSHFMTRPDWESLAGEVEAVYQAASAYSRQVQNIYGADNTARDSAAIQTAIEDTLRQRGVLGMLERDEL